MVTAAATAPVGPWKRSGASIGLLIATDLRARRRAARLLTSLLVPGLELGTLTAHLIPRIH